MSEKNSKLDLLQQLKESQDRLAQAIDCANLGTWDWHVPSGKVTYNENWASMLGYTLDEIDPHVDGWSVLLHPDDAQSTQNILTANLKGKTDLYINSHRLKMKNGEWKWVQARGRVLERDEQGNAIRHTGAVFDFHDTKTKELELESKEKELKSKVAEQNLELEVTVKQALVSDELRRKTDDQIRNLLQLAPEGIVVTNEKGAIEIFSAGAERMFGYDQKEIIGKNLEILLPPEHRPQHPGHLKTFSAENTDYKTMGTRGEIIGQRKDGSNFPAKASVSKTMQNGKILFTAIVHDTTQEKQAHNKLIKALKEANLANKSKSEFLANMSHELRTPLNAILGFSQLLQTEIFGPLGHEKYKEYSGDIINSGTHLLDIITDILDLSKIESGMTTLDKETFSLKSLIDECSAIISGRIKANNIFLVFDIDDPETMLFADKRRLKQTLLNLLSNSNKFTKENGTITVSTTKITTRTGKPELILSVEDTGMGIKPDKIPHLTEPFSQAHGSAHTRGDIQGTGLGLSLVKNFVEAHDGTLLIESQVGKGTKVTLTFPSSIFSDK